MMEDDMRDRDEAIDILVDSLFTGSGVVVDSELAATIKARALGVDEEYKEGGERSAATILLVASAVNSALIPVLDRWGPEVAAEVLDKLSGKYKMMGEGNVKRSH